MKNYNKIIEQLEKDLEKAHSDCDLLKDEVKQLELSRPSLINIFISELPHKNWNECIEILKTRKPEWW